MTIMVLKQLSMQAINPVLRRNNNDHLQVNIGIDVSEHSIIQGFINVSNSWNSLDNE